MIGCSADRHLPFFIVLPCFPPKALHPPCNTFVLPQAKAFIRGAFSVLIFILWNARSLLTGLEAESMENRLLWFQDFGCRHFSIHPLHIDTSRIMLFKVGYDGLLFLI